MRYALLENRGDNKLTVNGNQDRKAVDGFVIPRGSAKAFSLQKGQILRITAHEGKQVADVKFINAQNYKEQVSAWWSSCLNSERPEGEILGGTKRLTELYSKPPWERVMLRVIDDKVGDHLFNGSCSPKIRELMPGDEYLGDKTCVELFAECLEPYGISLEDLEGSGTFNVFMPVRFQDDENGTWTFLPPSCEKGDYIEFLAEMDILVAATSCPQVNVINDYNPKAMRYEIFAFD